MYKECEKMIINLLSELEANQKLVEELSESNHKLLVLSVEMLIKIQKKVKEEK